MGRGKRYLSHGLEILLQRVGHLLDVSPDLGELLVERLLALRVVRVLEERVGGLDEVVGVLLQEGGRLGQRGLQHGRIRVGGLGLDVLAQLVGARGGLAGEIGERLRIGDGQLGVEAVECVVGLIGAGKEAVEIGSVDDLQQNDGLARDDLAALHQLAPAGLAVVRGGDGLHGDDHGCSHSRSRVSAARVGP